MSTFTKIMDLSINRSPGENYRRLKAKIFTGTSDFLYNPETVLHTPWYLNEKRHIDRFFRYHRVIKNRIQWESIDFRNKTALEFGCGPLLGWGPMAAYLGCTHYICVEPRFDKGILHSQEIRKRYFMPLHEQLEANFREDLPYREFERRLFDRVEYHTVPLESCNLPENSVDLVISNGVLQHVTDLHGCVRAIAYVSRPACRQFHVQHFTDHAGNPQRPFKQIYTQSPEEYFKKSSLLNLKRPSEMITLFKENGISITLVPYLEDKEVSEYLNDYWKQFSSSDLRIRIAFLVN